MWLVCNVLFVIADFTINLQFNSGLNSVLIGWMIDWLNLFVCVCVCCRTGHLLLYILLTSRWPRLHSAQPKITDSTVSASLHVNTEINQQENLWERFSVTDDELQVEPTTPSQWTPSGRRMMMKKVEAAAGFRVYSSTLESWSVSAREPPQP